MTQELVTAIVEMREDDAVAVATELLDDGTSPTSVLDACRDAMDVVGQRFETGQCFMPEMILGGEILGQIAEVVKPRMDDVEDSQEKLGTIVFGTVEGDIHDIAKDIVAFMLDTNGFEVIDLGVDVPPQTFVDAVETSGADIVGLSGFLTLAYDPMKATVQALRDAGLEDVKVMVGGGQVDEHIRVYTGADAWGRDAAAAVKIAKSWT